MMSKNEFPEIDDFFLGRYRHGLSPQSRAIYLLTILAVVASMLCLPFIKIDISVSSLGVLQTSANKTVVSSSINGRVIKALVQDNHNVRKGDTLLLLDASATEKQVALNYNRQVLLQHYLDDLQVLLTRPDSAAVPQLKSGRYHSSYLAFLQEQEERQHVVDKEARNFERFNILHQKKFISDSEFEQHKNASEMASLAAFTFQKRYRAQLEQEASVIREELQLLASAAIDLQDQQQLRVIRSPDKGSLQLRKEIKHGTSIVANEILAEISPDSTLMAYCYVEPVDIALIRIGQEVHFQVTAFNYNEWGMLQGRVQEISDDVMIKGNGAIVYQIRCLITRDFMELKGGPRGYLKKGMTLVARFKVDKRSLYQLLYDRVDDWINPIQETNTSSYLSQQAK